MLRADAFVKSQLALAAWREAHYFGGSNPMLMVASALANRVVAGWGSWLQVIDQMPVFSALEESTVGQPDLLDPNVVHLFQAVDSIYDGSAKDITAGGLYWCDHQRPIRQWFAENIISRPTEHPRAASSITFQFYR